MVSNSPFSHCCFIGAFVFVCSSSNHNGTRKREEDFLLFLLFLLFCVEHYWSAVKMGSWLQLKCERRRPRLKSVWQKNWASGHFLGLSFLTQKTCWGLKKRVRFLSLGRPRRCCCCRRRRQQFQCNKNTRPSLVEAPWEKKVSINSTNLHLIFSSKKTPFSEFDNEQSWKKGTNWNQKQFGFFSRPASF